MLVSAAGGLTAGAGLLQQVHLLLEVGPAEELVGPEHELLALLQGLQARHAREAVQVEDGVLGAHDQLVRQHPLHAARALGREHPAERERVQGSKHAPQGFLSFHFSVIYVTMGRI